MRRALRLLAQLERQELERERQNWHALGGRILATNAVLADLNERMPEEHAVGWSLPGGPKPLAGYAREAARREVDLKRTLADLEAARERAEGKIRDRLADVKSLELTVERLTAQAHAEAARREGIRIEEASLLGRDANERRDGAAPYPEGLRDDANGGRPPRASLREGCRSARDAAGA